MHITDGGKMKINFCINQIYFKGQDATQPRLPGPEGADKGKQLTKLPENNLTKDMLQLKTQQLPVDNKNCVDCVKK